MLQTAAIKNDPAVSVQGAKDNDPNATLLGANFSSYFSQMMAALPTQPQAAEALPMAAAPARPEPRKAVQPQAQAQASPAAAADPSQASAAAAAAVAAPAQPVPATPAKAPDPSGPAPAAGQPAAPATAPAAAGAAAPAAGGGAQPQPQADAKAASSAQQAAAAAAPATQAAAAAPAAADARTAVDPKTAATGFDQAFPGGKFQVQVGEPAPQATTKAPLSEFVNPIPQASGTAVQGTGLAAEALGQVLSQVPVTGTAAGLAGLQAVAGLQAAPALLLALPAASGETASAGITQAGNVASAQAAGAGALPGAFGAVRVTAAAAAQPAQATRQQDLLGQVDGSIRFLVKNQDQSAELQLHPESLGRVQVKLTVEGTVVHAKLWASEAAAVPVLQEHRSYLEDSLRSQGLTLGSFDLQQGRREDQAPLPTPADTGLAAAGGTIQARAGQESPPVAAAASSKSSRIEFVA